MIKMSDDSVWLMCCCWWHICYCSLLAILRKKVGKSRKEIRNLYGFYMSSSYVNSHVRVHLIYEFIYSMSSYNTDIFPPLSIRGFFHVCDTLPLHGKSCSAIDEQTETRSKRLHLPLPQRWGWEKRSEVKSGNLNSTHAKSCLHRGMWNGQRYGRTLCMLMCSVIPSCNNIVKIPLMWTRSMV